MRGSLLWSETEKYEYIEFVLAEDKLGSAV